MNKNVQLSENFPLEICNDKYSKENVVYRAVCQTCRIKQILEGTDPKNVIERAYVGETAQIIKIRAAQYYDDFKNE